MHLPAYVYRVSFRRYRSLKLPLSCEVARFVGGGDTPDFGHAFSNCTYLRPCGRFSLSSVQRARSAQLHHAELGLCISSIGPNAAEYRTAESLTCDSEERLAYKWTLSSPQLYLRLMTSYRADTISPTLPCPLIRPSVRSRYVVM